MITLLPSSYSGINNRLSSDSGRYSSPSLSNGAGSIGDGFGANPQGINPEGNAGGVGEEGDDGNDDGNEDGNDNGNEDGNDGIDLRGAGNDSLDRATGTIQAVKRPTVKGVPEPISYQHRGLIPKARSEGSRPSPWLELVIATVAMTLVLTYR
jgi:hypothetical protein